MAYIGKQPTKAALTASDIEDGIITAAKIEDGAVVAAEIASNAVTTAKINADAVTSAKIADNAVVTAAINADAITGAKIADDAINSEHYTDGSIDTAHIADGQVTTAKLASAVFTGATDIGAAIVDADLFLMDDGAGGTIRKTTASRIKTYIGGGVNTPAFHASMGSDQTISDNTATKINFNTAAFDVGSCFDESSNYRFTVPSNEGGYYLMNAQIHIKSDDDGQHIESFLKVYKNGSANTYRSYDNFSGTGNTNGNMLYITLLLNLSAGDYFELYAQCNVTTSSPIIKAGNGSYWQAFKLIS